MPRHCLLSTATDMQVLCNSCEARPQARTQHCASHRRHRRRCRLWHVVVAELEQLLYLLSSCSLSPLCPSVSRVNGVHSP
jgi:hypothetical protein